MRPVDPRLLRHARATRVFLAASVALGVVDALLLIAQAVLVAGIVTTNAPGLGPLPGDRPEPVTPGPFLQLAAVTLGRALVAWLTRLAAHRGSAAVRSQLRVRLLTHATRVAPDEARTGDLTALATRGVDALDDYFARYLPQLALAVVVPLAVLLRTVTADWVAAATIAATLPLVPLFMVLIGWATQAHTDRRWRLLTRLSGHFLDVVAGLPTLKVFGRATAQAAAIRAITGDYRRATLRTLRIAFLSSFALELLATLSVALVAVSVGLRLVHGDLDLYTALLVLVLAPEAYLPLRRVGTHYHAAAEGLSAADDVFAVLATPARPHGATPAPDARTASLEADHLVVRHPGRSRAALPATSFHLRPGETLAVTGPSGAGKSTLLHTLLGLTTPTSGSLRVGGVDVTALDPADWHRQVAWVPQQPYLCAGTVADNVRLTRPDASDAAVRAALRAAGAADLDPRRELGEGGTGLSAGQRQRVGLARAVLADRPVLLLDEPTAALDGDTEQAVVDALRRLTADRTVVLVTHRPALLTLADRVLRLRPDTAPGTGAGRAGDATDPGAAAAGAPRHDGHRPGTPPAPQAGTPAASARRPALRGVVARRWDGAGLGARLALAALLGALALGSAVGLLAVSGWLLSRASQQPPVLHLMVAVTATRALGLSRAVFRYAERLVSHDAVLRLLAELRVAVYQRLERLAPAGLGTRRRGDLLSRLVADVDSLQDRYLRWRLPVAVAALVGLATATGTTLLLPEAGVVLTVGLLTVGVAVPALTAAVARHTERRLAPARGELAVRTVELLTGVRELTVAGALPGRLAAVREADRRLTRLAAHSAATGGLGDGLAVLVAGLTTTVAAWCGAQAVAQGRLADVWLATVVLTPLAAFEAVSELPQAVQHRQRARRAAERVDEVLTAPPPVREPATAPAGGDVTADLPRGPVVLRGVTARYPGAPTDSPPPLRELDLTLAPGRRLAVVGPSGAGKTTLAHVLLRFLDPDPGGSYTLGGADALRLPGDTVRRTVGLCAQDAHVFDSSLRENLRLARPAATDAQLRDALAAARLLAWVDTLPHGLDTLVGERGSRLSGGQRQRLALARALLADFPVLVLDEPAEHLDRATADALTRDLLAATAGRTTVLVTHHLAVLDAHTVDEVLVLDAGRVVQRGTYPELATADGPFRRMLRREREAARLASAAGPAGEAVPVGEVEGTAVAVPPATGR